MTCAEICMFISLLGNRANLILTEWLQPFSFIFCSSITINHFVKYYFPLLMRRWHEIKVWAANIPAHKKGAKCIHARLNFRKSILSLWLGFPIWFWFWSLMVRSASLHWLDCVSWMLLLAILNCSMWSIDTWHWIININICTAQAKNYKLSQMST